MLEHLNKKQITAIELKYLGKTMNEISEQLEVPFDTIGGWFESNGTLYNEYNKYAEKMNKERQKKMIEQSQESDEQIIVGTTNVMRKVMGYMMNKKDKFSLKDFETAWKIQRVMLGLPTDVRSNNVKFEDEEELEKAREELKKSLEEKNESNNIVQNEE